MNERIRELVKQAGGHISMRNLASNPVQHIESVELWDDRIEKFAQLIVQECVRKVRDRGGMCGALASNWIEEHFYGVEE